MNIISEPIADCMTDSPKIKFYTPLKGIQNRSLKFGRSVGNPGFSLTMGAGKTLIALAASSMYFKIDHYDYSIIIHIKSALKAFKDDAEKYTNLKLNQVHLTKRLEPLPCVNLIQTNQVGKNLQLLMKTLRYKKTLCIIDEVQTLKSATSKFRQTMDLLRPCWDSVWGLTATPINKIEDLYSLTEYLIPGAFGGSLWEFKQRYCNLRKRSVKIRGKDKKIKRVTFYEITGYKNLVELKQRLEHFWYIEKESMPVSFKYINLGPLEPDDEDKYLTAARGIIKDCKTIKEFGARLPELQRITDLCVKKQFRVRCIIEKIKEEGGLIYFPMKEALHLFESRLNALTEILTGDTSQDERGRIKDELAPGMWVHCTNAASQSLNLHAVNNIVFYTLPFDILTVIQMIGRVARPFVSSYDVVNVYIPYMENTIDQYRIELMKTNAGLINTLFGQQAVLPETMKTRRSALINMRKDLLWRLEKHAC